MYNLLGLGRRPGQGASMMLRGERVAGGSGYVRAALALRFTISDLMAEVSVGSQELAALGLLGLNLLLQTVIMVSPGHFRPVPVPALSPLVSLATLAGLALAFGAGLPLRRTVPLPLRRALCGLALLTLGGLSIAGVVYAVDGTRSV